MSDLRLKVNDYRAISNADIVLNGITVLSGINGTGKSTLSKLLYYSVRLTLEYDKNLIQNFYRKWERTLISIIRLSDDFDLNIDRSIIGIRHSVDSIENIEIAYEIIMTNINKISQAFILRNNEKVFNDREILKITKSIENSTFRNEKINKIKELSAIEDIFIELKNNIDKDKSNTEQIIKDRPLLLLTSQLRQYFGSKNIPFSLFENEIPIIDLNQLRLNNLFSIENVIYLDTPMFLNNRVPYRLLYGNSHWDDLVNIISTKPIKNLEEESLNIDKNISEIISGKISLDNNDLDSRLIYERNDGLKIDLEETATGIKSFAILQLLLSKGLLNSKTLMILDEPEAHLHPQWIVEYARILVSLNKYLGVKFMIASHNPDMVSAIRYISEKEETQDSLNFYLAEKHENKEEYNFKNLGIDIDPIFTSFNIALDRISEYGI